MRTCGLSMYFDLCKAFVFYETAVWTDFFNITSHVHKKYIETYFWPAPEYEENEMGGGRP